MEKITGGTFMDITVSEKYLWFPVDMSGEMAWVSVYDGDQKIQ